MVDSIGCDFVPRDHTEDVGCHDSLHDDDSPSDGFVLSERGVQHVNELSSSRNDSTKLQVNCVTSTLGSLKLVYLSTIQMGMRETQRLSFSTSHSQTTKLIRKLVYRYTRLWRSTVSTERILCGGGSSTRKDWLLT